MHMGKARQCKFYTHDVIRNKEQKHGQGKTYEEYENWNNAL
jgi:hypothetical protein